MKYRVSPIDQKGPYLNKMLQTPNNNSTNHMTTTFETIVSQHDWHGPYRGTIYTYHHYHSIAHESLGFYARCVKVLFVCENGIQASVSAGRCIVIPACVSHKYLQLLQDLV
jgi:uncharacterized protein YjlB